MQPIGGDDDQVDHGERTGREQPEQVFGSEEIFVGAMDRGQVLQSKRRQIHDDQPGDE
jgi:hypothetical protein